MDGGCLGHGHSSSQQQPASPQPQPSPLAVSMARGRASSGIGGSDAGRSASTGFTALTIAPWSPSATAFVGSNEATTRPTRASPAPYLSNGRAPAMPTASE